ncbi:MAG: CoA transferase [Chloroflexi bacterium]|nr:CoA transferase [Chloroflexota bacterium]
MTPNATLPSALPNLRVLEVGSLIHGPYCGKLLASVGATVIKAEPPNGGDPSRRRGPFPDDTPHSERSGLYLYLNTGKQSITLNLHDPAGRDLLHQLVAHVDMVIHDHTPNNAAAIGLDEDSLRAANPNVVIVPITPFGSSGPYADYRAGHLGTFHAGGEGWLLPNGVALDKFPDRPPIVAGANMGDYQAGLTAAVGALAAIYHRLDDPDAPAGQTVDASGQEAQLSVGYMPIQRHESEGITETRFSRYFRVGGVLPASDGYVELLTLEPRQFQGLLEFMGNPDWATPEMFSDPATHGPELNRHMREWFSQHTRERLYAEGQGHGGPVAPYYTPAAVFISPQQRERDFYTQVNHPETGPLEYTGAPFQLSETPTTLDRAPLLGEHNLDVYCGLLGYAARELAALARAGAV